MYYLAMDGGGTKLVGILFDEQYRLISVARAEGTHLSVYPVAEVCAHVADCYETLFADIPRPMHIERMYTICGDSHIYESLLPEGVTLGDVYCISEPVSALHAGSCTHSGFVALAGTGSDVFCIRDDQMVDVIGGWGAILGDEGSGVWLARHAMQAAIRAAQGWGEPTRFGEMLMAHYGFTELWDYVNYLYATPSPFRRLGELMPLMAQAANEGDEAILHIFRDGGRILARQMIAMLRRHSDMPPNITACGGAWKAHPAMEEAFIEAVRAEIPDAAFTLPRFEHIMAGPIRLATERGEEEGIAVRLEANFSSLVWNQKTHKETATV